MSAQLTPKQLAVLEALLSGSTVSAAAETAGIHRSTIHEWLHQLPFKSAYEEARRNRAQAVQDEMHAMAGFALAAMRDTLTDPSTSASTRLRAALAVLKSATNPEPVTRYAEQRLTDKNLDRFYDAVYLAAHREAVASSHRLAELVREETKSATQ